MALRMALRRSLVSTLALFVTVAPLSAQISAQGARSAAPPAAIRLLVRADDMGVAQSVDSATIHAYRNGIVRSTEVIVPGPWFLDAVRLLKENPGLDVGVHLALTSEWERVKWRPLTQAPSLVDADGYFRPMTTQRADFPPGTGFVEAGPKLDEVERELRAQIETARRHLGARVTHVSSHMLTSRATPALDSLTRRLAKEYGLVMEDAGGLRYAGGFGPRTLTNAQRATALATLIDTLAPGTWLLLEHAAYDTPEMRAIGHTGYEDVAADRAGVTYAFTSAEVKAAVARRGVRLMSYADLAPASAPATTGGAMVQVPQGMGTPQYVGANGKSYFSLVDSGPVARAQAAYDADPRNRDKVIALGTAQAGARQMREAVETFTRGLQAHPDDALLLRWRGHRNLSVRNFAKAKADLERAARIDSTIYGIWYHLGVLRYVQGDFAGAAASFRHALRAGPPDGGELAGSVDWLWMSLSRAGRSEEARALLASHPDTLPTTAAYAQRLKLYRGEIGPAELFTPGDTSDVNVATLSYGLGNWYLLKGDRAKAREWFERAIASGGWPAFGFIASEAELARLKRR